MIFGKIIVRGTSHGFRPIKFYLYKHFLPKRFSFKSVVPANKTKFQSLPYHQWENQKKRISGKRFIYYIAMFFIGFALSDFITTFLYNEKQAYRLHLFYPIPSKNIQNMAEWAEIKWGFCKKIWPKDYYEFIQFWETFFAWLKNEEERNRKQDQKALKLKQQIQEFDKKYETKEEN